MVLTDSTFIGVDGTSRGWVAVGYSDGFDGIERYDDAEELWSKHHDAETILVDVPIGMREDCAAPRECDTEARKILSPDRHRSVFPVPVRDAVHEDEYAEAKKTQEELTDGSLGTQSHAIANKISEVDDLLRAEENARNTIRESHPEVCFAALAGGEPMSFSKNAQPAAAFWERVTALESVNEFEVDHLRTGGETVTEWDDPECSNDDMLDAFVLALTASDLTDEIQMLPECPETDAKGLPMEIVYAET